MTQNLSLILKTTFSFSLYFIVLNASAEETYPNPTPKKTIHIYSEIIEIPSIQYAEIMTEPMTSTNQTALRNKLIQQVKKGEAKLISNQSIICTSNEKATTESNKELIYETEYEPGESIPTANKEETEVTFQMVLPPTPTCFEYRNVGTTVEIYPKNNANNSIDLRFKSDIVKHTGYNVFAEWKTQLAEVNVQMPNFYTNRMITNFSVFDNQFTLAGTYSPDQNGIIDESRKLLHFVRANILENEE